MTRFSKPARITGRAQAPASKSAMQRAVACAALAQGTSLLRSPSRCADALAALDVARALGASVKEGDEGFEIEGIGFSAAAPAGATAAGATAAGATAEGPASPLPRRLSVGESGLCLRMFTPIVALFPGESLLEGMGSLMSRPVTAIEGSLAALGASASTAGGFPPVSVRGPLRGGRATVDASLSSQFLTGLLIALPLAPEDSILEVPRLVSQGYIGLTLRTMAAFGLEVGADPGYASFRIGGGRHYRPADLRIEGDWSGGAFLLVAGAIAGVAGGGGLVVEGLDPESDQPDRAIVEALRLAGARVESERGPGGIAHRVSARALKAFSFDAGGCPDLFPPLVALASRCEGTTVLRGAERLHSKESDRALALKEEFGRLGVAVEVQGDTMRVTGGGIGGGRVDSRGDHRIAMAAAVAALAGEAPVEVDGAECVAKSWPSFFEDLGALARAQPPSRQCSP